ncbi:MAG: hypothetical protein UT66_C0031G0001 [candidate division CPR2 bacterium GW2011_GWC1_39_9]|uniref:Uncharacterized protein n=1 Tax=candidate division CPR2 bacterium GW2011_GWC2_39_10 TaxID=1618345 RepID=A0A0G0LMB4_UNCC2|nr:MAG: hypothetical protein UT18_C0028G0001 [candidate division CPR2 bacterium GW2011_GWC2_39_10]KKR33989.1 MAG: hypothetical protein UT66_C0031G0001 [candidate division CPR2 bacterium GW2011_GWC1_39_9]
MEVPAFDQLRAAKHSIVFFKGMSGMGIMLKKCC